MISAFGVVHSSEISKARRHPELPLDKGESNNAYEKRLTAWLKANPDKAAGVTRVSTGNPAQPAAKPKEAKPAAPKPEVKVETPKPEAPKAEAPKPEAPKPGGNMGASPQEAATPKVKDTSMQHAYEVGQKKAFREGAGPIKSAWNGVGFALKHHPGKTAGIAGAGAAGLAGATYLGGRAQQKKRDGR